MAAKVHFTRVMAFNEVTGLDRIIDFCSIPFRRLSFRKGVWLLTGRHHEEPGGLDAEGNGAGVAVTGLRMRSRPFASGSGSGRNRLRGQPVRGDACVSGRLQGRVHAVPTICG
jgi:hypothetical protein